MGGEESPGGEESGFEEHGGGEESAGGEGSLVLLALPPDFSPASLSPEPSSSVPRQLPDSPSPSTAGKAQQGAEAEKSGPGGSVVTARGTRTASKRARQAAP